MCGIAGCLTLGDHPTIAREDILAMVGALQHRGPDESGYYRDEHCALGHARLSIIDLSTGQQPMCDASRSVWLVFNGEIFNYLELRDELEAYGHVFRTASDTEVLLQSFLRWGNDAFGRFNGQFAVAIWDAERQELTLARDRLGVRPLYVCQRDARIWFASEVKAIFAGDPSMPRSIDPDGLVETFTFWSTLAPRTAFTGVSEIEPGHVRTIDRHGATDRPYWTPSYPADGDRAKRLRIEDAVEQVRDALDRAVRLRVLRADVPVGSYLSGGLDSSLVAALGRRYEGDRYVTFSVRFQNTEFDETAFQRQMAARLGSDHRELLVRDADIAASFPDAVWHAERPILRTAPVPLYLLSSLVRDAGIKVVLTGEGADEMFAGYDLFREGKVRRFWARQATSEIRPLLLERLYPYLRRSPVRQRALARSFFGAGLEAWAEPGFAHGTRWRATAVLQRLLSQDVHERRTQVDPIELLLSQMPKISDHWSPLAQDRYLETRTLLSGYLLSSQGDRMLMAHSVEGRFPFLDIDVVDIANSLPDEFLLRGLDEKHILKRAAEGLLPTEILRRPKQPYRAPDAVVFTDPGSADWVNDLVAESKLSAVGLFDARSVSRLWRRVSTSEGRTIGNSDNMALVGVLSTLVLHERFIERPITRTDPTNLRTIADRLAGSPGPAAFTSQASTEVGVGV